MPVKVMFMTQYPSEIVGVSAIGSCRACETLTVPDTGALVARRGETVLLLSTETDSIVAAHGTTPDAAAEERTSSTSAGYAVPPLTLTPINVAEGDKINVKAFV